MTLFGFSKASFSSFHFAFGNTSYPSRGFGGNLRWPRLHRSALVVVAALLVDVGLGRVAAATYTIRPDGTGDYPTIQEALWYVSDGDVIELDDGIFQGDLNHDIDFRSKAVMVRSASGDAAAVVVQCESTSGIHAGFIFDGTEGPGAILDGVTIRNALEGVFCDGTSPVVRNCVFEDCAPGVRIRGGAARIEDCRFRGGPMLGKAMFVSGATTAQILRGDFRDHSTGGVSIVAGVPTFDSCWFENNVPGISGTVQASPIVTNCDFVEDGFSFFGTGAPMVSDSRITGGTGSGIGIGVVEDCTFSDGDGISALVVREDAIVRGTRFVRNRSTRGAVAVGGGVARIESCEFWENEGQQGGAVWGELSAARFEDCLFVRNSADQGGCAYLRLSPAYFVNCTIVESSSANGSALYLDGADPVIENSIVAFGSGGDPVDCVNAGGPLVTCSDFYDGSGTEWNGCLSDQLGERGNISMDPLFCHPGTDDYTLAASSPAAQEHSGCGLMGALPVGCSEPVPTVETSWGKLKAGFRPPRH